jgi:hypothetical protein
MENGVFRDLLGRCLSSDSAISLESWTILLKLRDSSLPAFAAHFLRLLSDAQTPVPLLKMSVVIFDHNFRTMLKPEVSSLGDDLPRLFESVLSLFDSDDLQLVQLSSCLAADLLIALTERRENLSAIGEIRALLQAAEGQSQLFGLISVLFDVCEFVELPPELLFEILQQLFHTAITGSPFLKQRTLQNFRRLIPGRLAPLFEGEAVIEVLNLLFRLTFQSTCEGFLCWRRMVKKFPSSADAAFFLLLPGLLESLDKDNEDSLNAICMFIQAYCGKSKTPEILAQSLPDLVPKLCRLVDTCDLSVCDDTDTMSVHRSAALTLKLIGEMVPAGELFQSYAQNFECPASCLIALYFVIRAEIWPTEEQLHFLESCHQEQLERVRFLAGRCLAALAENFPGETEFVSIGLSLHHEGGPHFLRLFHRIVCALAGELKDMSEFYLILLSHLRHPHCYVSSSAHYSFGELASCRDDTSLTEFIIAVYSEAVQESAFDMQIDMCWIVSSLVRHFKSEFEPWCEQTTALLLETIRCEDFRVALEAVLPLATIVLFVDADFTGLLPEVLARAQHILRAFYAQQEMVVDAVATSLFYFLEKCDVSHYLPDFLNGFLQIFFETRDIKCVSAVADISESDLELVMSHGEDVRNMLHIIRDIFQELSVEDANDVLTLIRNVGDSDFWMMGIELIECFRDQIEDRFPACSLILRVAESSVELLRTVLEQKGWIVAFVGECLNHQATRKPAQAIAQAIGPTQFFGVTG